MDYECNSGYSELRLIDTKAHTKFTSDAHLLFFKFLSSPLANYASSRSHPAGGFIWRPGYITPT